MSEKTYGVIVAGVGGQGAITIAQLILGAAWKDGYYTLQSEVHGMSQRGGEVNAHIVFSKDEVTAPVIAEGTADLLVGLEPLEAMRYFPCLAHDAQSVVDETPIINMDTYPEIETILSELRETENVKLIDGTEKAKEINHRLGSNIIILGQAAKYLPFSQELWEEVITQRFKSKGEKVIQKNIDAFKLGYNL